MLDTLDPEDPLATRSRRDLRRVHIAMRTVSILKTAVRRLSLTPPQQILELGGGDGSLTLRLAHALNPQWPNVTLTILDRHDIVSPQTRRGYSNLGWHVQVVREDVVVWATQPSPEHYDLCLTSLFLHHFDNAALRSVMRAISTRSDALVACEPRRSGIAAFGSTLIGLLGTNRVTRDDAVTSVAAGFTQTDLSELWPHDEGAWLCRESSALPFAHCFTAKRLKFEPFAETS